MLLHNININVAIADILLYRWRLYDAQEPIYQKSEAKNYLVHFNCPWGLSIIK